MTGFPLFTEKKKIVLATDQVYFYVVWPVGLQIKLASPYNRFYLCKPALVYFHVVICNLK